jgi:hypothetical protein
MARAGMSDEEMTAFIKETFCVDSTYKATDLFAAAQPADPPTLAQLIAVARAKATPGPAAA